jgi:hypothetical protein
MNPESKRTILIASIGISPAVLTNAVWALAQEYGANVAKKELFAAPIIAQKTLVNESHKGG